MTKPLVVIIEDDPQLNKIFSLTLQADFAVESFSDGDAALAKLPQLNPTMIVLDLNLPGASGKDILHALRADTRLARTRVILTTADDRLADTLRAEADMVLLKPVSPTQLRELAKRLQPQG